MQEETEQPDEQTQPEQVIPEAEVANICCLCQHNVTISAGFTHCGLKSQKSQSLKIRTLYNDGCELFKEASHRRGIYDTKAPATSMNPKYSCECGWSGDSLKWIKSPAKKYHESGGGFHGCPTCKSKHTTKNW